MRFINAIATGAFALTPFVATAATLDLTSASFANGQSIVGTTVSLAASGGPLDNSQAFDGMAKPAAPLSFETDGFGIAGDEISGNSSITVSFGRSVRINRLYFLDLFSDPRTIEQETALISFDGGAPIAIMAMADFTMTGAGFLSYGITPILAQTVTFSVAAAVNDGIGVPDYALAGLGVTAIPLPAPAWLLLGGLGGLYILRRRGASSLA